MALSDWRRIKPDHLAKQRPWADAWPMRSSHKAQQL